MILINKNCSNSLKKIVLQLIPPINDNKNILKCIDGLIIANKNDYKYGSSWIDYSIRSYTIRKINRLLKNGNYNIIIS